MIRRPPRSTLFPLHDALPISACGEPCEERALGRSHARVAAKVVLLRHSGVPGRKSRSEEHTSELQSRQYLVCRLLLEKKKSAQTALPLRDANLFEALDGAAVT